MKPKDVVFPNNMVDVRTAIKFQTLIESFGFTLTKAGIGDFINLNDLSGKMIDSYSTPGLAFIALNQAHAGLPVTMRGHTSFDTAVIVEDYPYGYNQRTELYYWIEFNKTHGYRSCSQTINPKTGKFNKPKKSTYSYLMVMIYSPAKGHIGNRSLNYHAYLHDIEAFESEHEHYFDAEMVKRIAWLKAARAAESKVTYEISVKEYALVAGKGLVQIGGSTDDEPHQTLQEQADLMHQLTAYEYLKARS